MDRAGANMKATETLANETQAGARQQATPHRTRIKLCGLSKPQDVSHAIDLGAEFADASLKLLLGNERAKRHFELL